MVRNVRNWWIEVEIDGRQNILAGGPQSKDGGFVLTIRQRDGGAIRTPLKAVGIVKGSNLELEILGPENAEMYVTTR